MFGRKKGDKKGQAKVSEGPTKAMKKQLTGKYGKTKIKHSGMGKASCWMALLSFVLIFISILIAYVMRGKTVSIVGGFGVLAVVMAALGFRAAMKGFRDRDRNYLTCRIGIALNSVILLVLIIIFFRGVL